MSVADDDRDLLVRSDDAVDVVVCALVARASLLGLGRRPAPQDAENAAIEGWIAVPTGDVSEQSGPATQAAGDDMHAATTMR